MSAPTLGDRIKENALKFLEQNPDGLRYSELRLKIQEADSNFEPKTINGNIWNLDATFPSDVYKPSKGIFRLTKFKTPETEVNKTEQLFPTPEEN